MSEAVLTNSPSPEAAIDAVAIEQLRELGDGDELLVQVIDLFLEDAPLQVQTIEAAARESSDSEIAAAAHSLKSSCASVGALTMSQICKQLEFWGRQGNLAEVPELLPLLIAEWKIVSAGLAAIAASSTEN